MTRSHTAAHGPTTQPTSSDVSGSASPSFPIPRNGAAALRRSTAPCAEVDAQADNTNDEQATEELREAREDGLGGDETDRASPRLQLGQSIIFRLYGA
eukprot:6182671-Pleurochrysis_carterae.AAC.2